MVHELLPEVEALMLFNHEGVALAVENIGEDPQEVSSMVSAFYSTLLVAGHDKQEIAVLWGQASYILIVELHEDLVLLIKTPQKRTLDEYPVSYTHLTLPTN